MNHTQKVDSAIVFINGVSLATAYHSENAKSCVL